MRWFSVVLAVVVLMVRPAPARADTTPLDEARQAVESSDYVTARTLLAKALESGGAQPDELAEIYKLSGIVEAALGNTNEATVNFRKWLALDPKAMLPVGTSPKITRPFDAARKQMQKLETKTETSADPPRITLVIASDPIGITHARVVVSVDGKPEKAVDGDGSGKITIELPRGHRLDLRVEALDSHGNRVVVLGSSDVPIVIIGKEPGPPPPPPNPGHPVVSPPKLVVKSEPAHPRPLWARWWLWGVGTVAVAGVGAYFGVEARSGVDQLQKLNATSTQHKFTDATALEATTRDQILYFNIGMGVAGALALTTALLYVTEPREQSETRVVATPVRGGGVVTIGGAF
jgi:hypothetical protein